jgi:hypothetical protein
MSDWTYEPLIVTLKAVLAEAESGDERKAPPTRIAPAVAGSALPRRESKPDLQRS